MHRQTSNSERKFGNYVVLKYNSQGQPQFMLGPHWPIAIISILFTTGMVIWLILFLKDFLSFIWITIISVVTIIYLYAYVNIAISYPGFAKPIDYDHQSINSHIRFCPICRTIQINHVRHCEDCNICIQDYDHHCPWTGKCIGGKNVRSFHFFLMMIFAQIAVCLICLLYQSATTEENARVHPNF